MPRYWLLLLILAVAVAATPVSDIRPLVETESMPNDVDDPAIWVNPADPGSSLIIGTVKRPKPDGALAVFTLDGKLVETVNGIDRPNNVDVLGDICVVTERLARRLRVFRVHGEKPYLRPAGDIPVFAGESGESGAPMGIALYRRNADSALFAIVSRKTGPREGYLWQYRLFMDGGRFNGEKVRSFGAFSGSGEIEAVAVDHERQLVYYADEDCCIRVYHADPAAAASSQEVARFAESGFRGNREGIAVAGEYVIATDQLATGSEYHVYDRDHRREIALWRGVARSTDGIDAIASPMGPRFPRGFLVAMNEARRNFQLYSLP